MSNMREICCRLGNHALDGDARKLMKGRKNISGPARYWQIVPSRRANVIVVPKVGCKQTWGIQAKHDHVIEKGQEILLDWNLQYPIIKR